MSSKFKPYKSLFPEEVKDKKEVKTSRVLEKSLRELYRIKKSLRKMREEDEMDSSAVEDAIDKISDIASDIIDEVGITSSAIDTLADAASELEMSDSEDEEEFDFEDEFSESEEDDSDEEEDDEEEVKEAEDEEEEDKDGEDDKKEESRKKFKKK